MLNILIAEDNRVEREFLKLLLEEISDVRIVGEAEDGLQALDLVSAYHPDIVFLDINMPGINGVEVARHLTTIRSKPFVVFVTVESKFAVEAFELDTVDYLLKPFNRPRLRKTMARVRERMAARAAMINRKKPRRSVTKIPKLFIQTKGEIRVINISDIIFVETSPDKRTIIHTVKGVCQSKKTLAEIQQELSRFPNFVRCHKSYLINIDMIERITPWGDSSYKVEFVDYEKDALVSRKHSRLIKEIFS